VKAGPYTVNRRFIVERNGGISDARALNDPGFGLAIGAVGAVRTGPAEQNGKKVRCYRTQPIIFTIQEEGKKNKKGDS
jgi:periplasmic protein TonB